jgi:ADP-ribose pyrophosphatase
MAGKPPKDTLLPWTVRESRLVLDNPWAKVRRDTCRLPNGREIEDYFYWEGGDFSQTLALTRERQVVLTQQYKHGVKQVVTELPAGLVDIGLESPLQTAQRELLEETGHIAQTWHLLGTLNVSAAKSTTRAHIFMATDAVRAGEQELDATEAIEVKLVSIEQLLEMVERGEILDVTSIAAIFLGLRTLGRV